MGYCIRVLSPSDDVPPYSALEKDLFSEHPQAALSIEAGSDSEWDQLLLSHQNGSEIAVVERSFVAGLVAEEIEEFLEEIGDHQPQSSVEWLRRYLPTVRTIYAFQVLTGVESNSGGQFLGRLSLLSGDVRLESSRQMARVSRTKRDITFSGNFRTQ